MRTQKGQGGGLFLSSIGTVILAYGVASAERSRRGLAGASSMLGGCVCSDSAGCLFLPSNVFEIVGVA